MFWLHLRNIQKDRALLDAYKKVMYGKKLALPFKTIGSGHLYPKEDQMSNKKAKCTMKDRIESRRLIRMQNLLYKAFAQHIRRAFIDAADDNHKETKFEKRQREMISREDLDGLDYPLRAFETSALIAELKSRKEVSCVSGSGTVELRVPGCQTILIY